jgi:hypothetical protein
MLNIMYSNIGLATRQSSQLFLNKLATETI